MFEDYRPQPITTACDRFAADRRRSVFAEPDLAELMRDPMTLAVMAADHVDRGELDTLLAELRGNLR